MRPFLRRLLSTGLAATVSAVVLWWLLADGVGRALLESAEGAHGPYLALGCLLAIAIQLIRAWRFHILRTGHVTLPSWTMIGIATKLVLFNFLLPFKLGELSFPLMMRRAYGTALGEAAGILIFCRLLDLGVVTAFVLIAAAWLIDAFAQALSPELVTVLCVAALITPLMIVDRLTWIQRLVDRWPAIRRVIAQMLEGMSMTGDVDRRALIMMLTLSIWIGHAAIAWLVAMAIGADLGFPSMVMASAASNLTFALPISGVAGLGPPQAAWATMLHWAGHDWGPAIASALLCHGLLLVTLCLFGAVVLARNAWHARTLDDASFRQR